MRKKKKSSLNLNPELSDISLHSLIDPAKTPTFIGFYPYLDPNKAHRLMPQTLKKRSAQTKNIKEINQGLAKTEAAAIYNMWYDANKTMFELEFRLVGSSRKATQFLENLQSKTKVHLPLCIQILEENLSREECNIAVSILQDHLELLNK
jgi:hypothetical protein